MVATPLAPFPDVERVVADLVSDLGGVGRETGTDLQTNLPFIRVRRIGGSDDRFTDVARVDVRVYEAAASDAKALAETIRQRLLAGPANTARGVIDRVFTEVAPIEVPSPDPERYCIWSGTYRVSLRRR